jgi:tetraprenyl-beta-curcumene synthase
LGQTWTLLTATIRELLWGLPAVSREVSAWRELAAAIPDAHIRQDALESLARKRPHLDGAALFWILPRRRNLALLRLLVAYEITLEFLDSMNERAAHVGQENGRQLHLALAEALDPDAPISDYYSHHPWKDDGGYLRMLVEACRRGCASLPSYSRVRLLTIREATRAQVLALNHDPDSKRREIALREWVSREFPDAEKEGEKKEKEKKQEQKNWFELSGAATASLTIHALLALASEPGCSEGEVASVHAAYFPGLSLTTTMLDSYVDRAEDATNGDHSYISHYASHEVAIGRVYELIRQSVNDARRLDNGHRHAVIAACMVAMYLSRDSAREPASRSATRQLIHAGGSLTRLLLPILRAWRIAYALRSA